MLDLPERWKAQLQEIMAQYAPTFEVWAYGSRVTGQCHEASDLDVVLIHPTHPDTKTCETLAALKEALSQSDIPITVDVMDWARLSPEFHQQINRQRVKLFPASSVGVPQ